MPTIQHNVLTTSDLHEPKGISTASAGDVYVADGAGSGTWTDQNIAYGTIYSQPSDSVAIATIGTTVKVFAGFSTNGEASGTVVDKNNSKITVSSSGKYLINFTISFSTVAAGDAGTYTFRVRIGGVEKHIGFTKAMSGTSDVGSATCSGILSLSASDEIKIYVASDEAGDTDDINVAFASLTVMKVAD